MSHPITAVDAATLAAHLPVQREAILRVLAHAIPPAATDEPYVGQECVGLTDAWRALYTLVRSTLHQGEGNSCLVMGEPGCGKSLVRDSRLTPGSGVCASACGAARHIAASCAMDRETVGSFASHRQAVPGRYGQTAHGTRRHWT